MLDAKSVDETYEAVQPVLGAMAMYEMVPGFDQLVFGEHLFLAIARLTERTEDEIRDWYREIRSEFFDPVSNKQNCTPEMVDDFANRVLERRDYREGALGQ